MNLVPQPQDPIDLLMEQVAHELANPAPQPGFHTGLAARLLERTTMPAAPSNVLSFPTFLTLDRSAAQPTSRKTLATAILLHAAAILLITLAIATKTNLLAPDKVASITLADPLPPPVKMAPKSVTMGGGGGQRGPAPVIRGNPPKFAPEQLNPPKAPPTVAPKIAVPVTVDVDPNLKMAKADALNFGMPNSPLIGTSLGNGRGTGIGSGTGAGLGAGAAGNMGGGLRRIGGGVSAPVALYTPEPEFSEEARKAKVAGNVLVYLQVDTNGRPTNVHVLRGIGLGLDEKAVEAVKQYKFKPAMENGKPVRVEMNVEVNFQIF